MTEQTTMPAPPSNGAKSRKPPQDNLAAQISQAIQNSPELAAEVVKSLPADALKKQFLELVETDPEIRKNLGVSGKPKRRERTITNSDIQNFAAVYGDATHAPDFLPTPPEHIVKRGEVAVREYHEKWLDGKQYGSFGAQAVDASMVADAQE